MHVVGKVALLLFHTGPVHPDKQIQQPLVWTADGSHRKCGTGGTGLRGAHGTWGQSIGHFHWRLIWSVTELPILTCRARTNGSSLTDNTVLVWIAMKAQVGNWTSIAEWESGSDDSQLQQPCTVHKKMLSIAGSADIEEHLLWATLCPCHAPRQGGSWASPSRSWLVQRGTDRTHPEASRHLLQVQSGPPRFLRHDDQQWWVLYGYGMVSFYLDFFNMTCNDESAASWCDYLRPSSLFLDEHIQQCRSEYLVKHIACHLAKCLQDCGCNNVEETGCNSEEETSLLSAVGFELQACNNKKRKERESKS